MKLLSASVVMSLMLCMANKSCDMEFGKWEREYDPDSLELCLTDEYEDWDAVGDDHYKHVVIPLVTSEECNCTVEGMLKYRTRNPDQTVALIDYGDGLCDGWAVKTLCVEGKCEHPEATMCKFAVKCGDEEAGD